MEIKGLGFRANPQVLGAARTDLQVPSEASGLGRSLGFVVRALGWQHPRRPFFRVSSRGSGFTLNHCKKSSFALLIESG